MDGGVETYFYKDFVLDNINNFSHMGMSGTEPSSMILSQTMKI